MTREEAIEAIKIFKAVAIQNMSKTSDFVIAFNMAIEALERPHGEWIEKKDPYDFFDSIPVCSECGCINTMRKRYNFCPNCGADMRDSND